MSRYHYIDERRDFEPGDSEAFDRMEFALHALRLLRPADLTVALYPRVKKLIVERGRDIATGGGTRWAIVGIPPDASRRHIAHALAELSGAGDVPYMVEVLVRHTGRLS